MEIIRQFISYPINELIFCHSFNSLNILTKQTNRLNSPCCSSQRFFDLQPPADIRTQHARPIPPLNGTPPPTRSVPELQMLLNGVKNHDRPFKGRFDLAL